MASVSSSENMSLRIPHDVLREIFLYCLPKNPLDEIQPNTKIAPMLLCHICSSWRTVALASASLWSHLYVKLPIRWSQYGEPIVCDYAALARNVEFMKWWRTNQGSMAPFIHFDMKRVVRRYMPGENPQETNLEAEIADFLLEFVLSARYLAVGPFYPYLTELALEKREKITFSNLHTLAFHRTVHHYYGEIDNPTFLLPSFPSMIPSTVRRLFIYDERIPPDFDTKSWTQLTHLSLNCVHIHLDTWFSLIRALVNLQWGDFYVGGPNSIEHPAPIRTSLPKLLTLSFATDIHWHHIPLSKFFHNLHLPSLHTLSLHSAYEPWRDSLGAVEIRNVLKSVPKVKKLDIGAYGKEFAYCKFLDIHYRPTTRLEEVEPLSVFAPHITDVQVELSCNFDRDAAELAERYVKEPFLSRHWLDIYSPINTVRTVTIVVGKGFWTADPELEGIVKVMLMRRIRDYHAMETSNITFRIASDEEREACYSENVWKTWALV